MEKILSAIGDNKSGKVFAALSTTPCPVFSPDTWFRKISYGGAVGENTNRGV